ncbi:MAG TPA: HAMP domain-containing sensor histidine kinase [Anaerolineales bacterium]|nr:HAMP domain-containing sensor histidine kinase [Anaerolineales bacterium]
MLIVTALGVVAFVLILFLLHNPVLYRQTFVQLRAADSLIANQSNGDVSFIARSLNVRILTFDSGGILLTDTDPSSPAISLPSQAILARITQTVRDRTGKFWLYTLRQLANGDWLMVASPRPKVPVLALLTDELLAPILEGGAIALLLSLILAFVIARWIADPLQRLISAARAFPQGTAMPVDAGGPHEVRELTRVFNAMMTRVQASQKSQRDFVANVSHELKTPLTSIQGFAQAIMDGTVDTPDDRKQAAEVIYSEAGRMHRMALDLLDLARLDAGILNLQTSPVDIRALLNGIIEKFTPMASKAGVTLMARFANDLPPLYGDGDRLAQVFTNLVDNALKFTPEGGSIALRAVRDRNEIQVAVDDTGTGIPKEDVPHIFDRFYQADSARAGGEHHGAGLGLAIVHEIVAAHGGRISVRSAVGRGTAFIVHLPLNSGPL